MKRLEVVANQSVQEEVTQALEAGLPGVTYTLIPVAHGRGGDDWRLGNTTWPEENFVLFTYQDDAAVEKALGILKDLKAKFPREGMKWWTVRAE